MAAVRPGWFILVINKEEDEEEEVEETTQHWRQTISLKYLSGCNYHKRWISVFQKVLCSCSKFRWYNIYSVVDWSSIYLSNERSKRGDKGAMWVNIHKFPSQIKACSFVGMQTCSYSNEILYKITLETSGEVEWRPGNLKCFDLCPTIWTLQR